jgi:hypothetical protein
VVGRPCCRRWDIPGRSGYAACCRCRKTLRRTADTGSRTLSRGLACATCVEALFASATANTDLRCARDSRVATDAGPCLPLDCRSHRQGNCSGVASGARMVLTASSSGNQKDEVELEEGRNSLRMRLFVTYLITYCVYALGTSGICSSCLVSFSSRHHFRFSGGRDGRFLLKRELSGDSRLLTSLLP